MSDSDESPLPGDARIENALRDAVISIFKSGDSDELTVRRVRITAAKELFIPAEFLKGGTWNTKSKGIIHDQVNQCQEEEAALESSPPKKKATARKPATKPKAVPKKSKPAADSPRGVRRRSPASKPKSQKRRKVASSNEESDAAESTPSISSQAADSDSEAGPVKPRYRLKAKAKRVDSDENLSDESPVGKGNKASDDDESDEEKTKPSPAKPKAAASKATDEVSEDEFSDVLDEPPTKKQRKSSTTAKPKSVPKPKAPKAKPTKDLTPQEAEIKQLQSHLVSCGVKKVWARYLAQYDTPKAKISHLKELLRDVGMDGRYTLEKAQKIKAQRELAAELDAVQEGAKNWGNSSDDGGRPRRRAAARVPKPVAPLKFDSDDSEETADKDAGDDGSDDGVEDDQGDDDQNEASESEEESAFSDSD